MKLWAKKGYEWAEDGLVGLWSPVNTGATGLAMLDGSEFANHGTAINYSNASQPWAGSQFGSVLDFDGSNDYIELATGDRQYPNLTSFTLNFWIKFDAFTNAYNQLLETSLDANQNYQASCLVKSNGKLAFYIFVSRSNQSSYDGTGSFTLVSNRWYMLTYVFQGAVRQQGFVDGRLDGSATNPVSSMTASSSPLWLSRSGFATRHVDGQYAEVVNWSRDLTASEIQTLYRLGPGGIWQREPRRNRSYFAQVTTFKNYWFRQQQHMIGGGIR